MRKLFLGLLIACFLMTFVSSANSNINKVITTDSGWTTTSKSLATGELFVTPSYTAYIVNITKASGEDATKLTIRWRDNTTVIATSTTLSGNTFTFPSPIALPGGNKTFYFLFDKQNASYTLNYKAGTYTVVQDGWLTKSVDDCNITVTTPCTEGTTNYHGLVAYGIANYTIPTATATAVSPANASTILANVSTAFNWSSTAGVESLVNTTLYINGVLNETINITGSSNSTQTNKIFTTPGSYNWTVMSCATSVCGNSTTQYFTISKILFNSVTYTSTVIEGSITSIVANISLSSPLSLTSVYVNYSNTNYSANIQAQANNIYIANLTFTAPIVSGTSNNSFNFLTSLNDSSLDISRFYYQTVSDVAVGSCSTYNVTLYNFTIVDEISQARLNQTTQNTLAYVTVNLYSLDRSVSLSNYSATYNKTNPFQVCLSNNSIGVSDQYSIDAQIQSGATGYASEYYNIQYATLNVSTLYTNITLYNLDNVTSLPFRITVRDSSYLIVPNAIIQVQRKYTGEGLFKTVEQPLTDIDGQTIAHLQVNDVIYNFIILVNGQVFATFYNKQAYCPTPSFNECTIDLNEFDTASSTTDFSRVSGILFDLNYNRTTRTLTDVFSIPSGTSGTVVLNVTLNDNFGNNTICSTSLVSSSGTLSCVIPGSFGNSSVIAKMYYNGVQIGESVINIAQDPGAIYVGSRVLIALIMVISLVSIGLIGLPVISGLLLLVCAILLVSLNIVASTGIIGASSTILWFIIAIVLVIFRGGTR